MSASDSVYHEPLRAMKFFHKMHQTHLKEMCEDAKEKKLTLREVKSLAWDIQDFCSGLHGHHSIEDAYIFPRIGAKTDISHLEKHHQQLTQLLDATKSMAKKLHTLTDISEYDSNATLIAVSALRSLVIEHETAEEAVLNPDNLKKIMSVDEIRRLLSH